MATSRGKKKSTKRYLELQQESTAVRRSPRISERHGRRLPPPSTYVPLMVSARPTIQSYNVNILNESGQSVPSSYNTDDTSFESSAEASIQHDHTYSNQDHTHIPFMITTHETPVPISTSSPSHLFGLDISGEEEEGAGEEDKDIHSSKEFNRHYKDRTITPRKPPPPQSPSFLFVLLSQVIRLFYSIGSLFYLLPNAVFCWNVSLLHKFGLVCNGPNGRRSFCGCIMLFAIFCLASFCLIGPYIEYPVIPFPPPPASSPSPSPSVPIPPPPVSIPPPPPPVTSTVVSTVTATVSSTPIIPPPNNDHTFSDIYRLIEELRNSLKQSDLKNEQERARLWGVVNSINIDKSLKDHLNIIDDKIRQREEKERARTDALISKLEDTLKMSSSAAVNRSSSLEESLKEEILKRPKGTLTEERVKEIVQEIVKEINDKLLKLIDSMNKEDQTLSKEMEKMKGLLQEVSAGSDSKVGELQTQLESLSDNITAMLTDLSNDRTADRTAEILKWQQFEDKLKNHAATLKIFEESLDKISKAPSVTGGVSEQFVWEAIKTALFNYSADNIARLDFALESVGGQVIANSDTYDPSGGSAQIFGIKLPITVSRSSPTAVIQASVLPGDCWCFKGNSGFVTIKLAHNVYIDAVSIQHIPKLISPDGSARSAPKNIKVFGQTSSLTEDSLLLGTFEYRLDDTPIQTFPISDRGPLNYVRFQFDSNYGSPAYTCIYRVRVHGSLHKTTTT